MTGVTIEQAIQMALAHQRAGRLAEATAICREVVVQVPHHPDALHVLDIVAENHNQLGQSLYTQGRRDEAIADFVHVVELRPDSAEASNNLGVALRGAGRLDEAITAYRRALALRSNYAAAHNNLGNALWEAGQIDEAITNLHRAVRLRLGWPRHTTTWASPSAQRDGSTTRLPPSIGPSH